MKDTLKKENFVKKWQARYEVHPQDLEDIYDDLVKTLISEAEAFDSYRGKLWSTAIQKCWNAPFPLVAMQYLLQRVYTKAKKEREMEIVEMIRNIDTDAIMNEYEEECGEQIKSVIIKNINNNE